MLTLSPAPSPHVTFLGAARSVSGSMHLVEAAGRKVLLDCGSLRRSRLDETPVERSLPFVPSELDAVVLSHAHVDHCGLLPELVRQGYSGPIYCTAATRDLAALMLADSARIQEHEAFVLNAVGRGGDSPARSGPSRDDVARTVQQFQAIPYGRPQAVSHDLEIRLDDAGHLPGSAMVALVVAWHGRERRVTFTGDLGRPGAALLRPAAPVPAADVVVCESTSGGRVLETPADTAAALAEVVRRTVERGGKVLIPAFSLGRTQAVVDCLLTAMACGRVPVVPVYVDSPLATDLTEVYGRHRDALRPGADLHGPGVNYLRSTEESEELDERREPCVIVAPGGMCEGGRIVRHLKNHIDDPRCSVVLVSYQAPGTLGRRLLTPGPRVRIHGRSWNRWADVLELPGFSGHPDQQELLAYLEPLAGRVGRVCLVHGELEQGEVLAGLLRRSGFADVALPGLGESVALGTT